MRALFNEYKDKNKNIPTVIFKTFKHKIKKGLDPQEAIIKRGNLKQDPAVLEAIRALKQIQNHNNAVRAKPLSKLQLIAAKEDNVLQNAWRIHA